MAKVKAKDSVELKKSVWVILSYEDQVLLLKRGKKANNPGLWNFPGGGVEGDETAKETVARELWEEAGIRISQSRFRAIKTIQKKGRLMLFYHVELQRPVTPVVDGKEISKFRWVSVADYPEDHKLHFQTRMFVKEAREETGV